MKTKIVYILVSDPSDHYLEMTFVSAYSARMHNNEANILLVTDESTIDSCCAGIRKDFLNLFDEVKVFNLKNYNNKKKKSRYLKTNLRNLINGDYLFIDSDTIICDRLDDIDKINHEIAFVTDIHLNKNNRKAFWLNESMENLVGANSNDDLFNGGVSYVKDCYNAHLLFEKWNLEWQNNQRKGIDIDQPSLHRAIEQSSISIGRLNGVWNCQISANFLPYLQDAKIIHTFTDSSLDSPYLLKNSTIYNEIKKNNGLTPEVINIIKNPRSAFESIHMVLGGKDAILTHSSTYYRISYLYKNSKSLFWCITMISKLLIGLYGVSYRIKSLFRHHN